MTNSQINPFLVIIFFYINKCILLRIFNYKRLMESFKQKKKNTGHLPGAWAQANALLVVVLSLQSSLYYQGYNHHEQSN
jgi:TRAP-type mannitol/chloroaromatic compound transport system permease small subunit